MRGDDLSEASAAADARRAGALGVLGVWTVLVPYVGRAVGLRLDVASKLEVVDHIVPGVLVVAIAGLLTAGARRGRPGGATTLLGGGVCFLAGFWVLATHVPLLVDAAHADEGWPTALWHASTGLPIVVISLWIVLRQSPDPGGGAPEGSATSPPP